MGIGLARRQDAEAVTKWERQAGLDVVRGIAVVLLLLDHFLATLWGVYGWGWTTDVRYLFTRPSLPLFMLASGTLVELHRRAGRTSVLPTQAWRVLPWALAAGALAPLIPKFNEPEPLTIYLLALPVLWVFRGREWLGLVVMGLVAINVARFWPLPSYDPAEQGMWLLVGVLLARSAPQWWDRVSEQVSVRSSRTAGVLAALGRRSLYWYVGQLAVLAAFCLLIGAPRGWAL